MRQLSLFGSSSRRLVDDAEGWIELRPGLIDQTTASAWFDSFHRDIAWGTGSRRMYDREVEVPRLRASYRVGLSPLPALLARVLDLVRSEAGAPFNGIGLNLYRDRHDSVAPHNDRLTELVAGQPIALLSLGASRQMIIRRKQAPHRTLKLDLHAGDLLLMSWTTQLHYDHSIPKQTVEVAPRISLAFRVHRD